MKHFYFILLPLMVYAFEVQMIDDTKEGRAKAKQNSIATDGKVIYKAIEPKIIEAKKSKIINAKKPNIIKPKTIKIIYPIGSKITPIQKRESNSSAITKNKTNEEDIFISKEALKKGEQSSEKIIVESFGKIKESNKTDTIEPINIK